MSGTLLVRWLDYGPEHESWQNAPQLRRDLGRELFQDIYIYDDLYMMIYKKNELKLINNIFLHFRSFLKFSNWLTAVLTVLSFCVFMSLCVYFRRAFRLKREDSVTLSMHGLLCSPGSHALPCRSRLPEPISLHSSCLFVDCINYYIQGVIHSTYCSHITLEP
jgi:hypothetical protein